MRVTRKTPPAPRSSFARCSGSRRSRRATTSMRRTGSSICITAHSPTRDAPSSSCDVSSTAIPGRRRPRMRATRSSNSNTSCTAVTTEYRPTLFDKYGPAAGDLLRAWALGLTVFGTAVAAFAFQGAMSIATFLISAALGVGGAAGGYLFSHGAGTTAQRFTAGGSTTPYEEQYSYQQALVMQGRVDEALESFEAVIAEKPEETKARI